jgi:hypothetical protein
VANNGDNGFYAKTNEHSRLLRVGSAGDSSKIVVEDLSGSTFTGAPGLFQSTSNASMPSLITNSDQGVLGSYAISSSSQAPTSSSSKASFYLATTSDASVTSRVQMTTLPGQQAPTQPALQAQDNSLVGTVGTQAGTSMIAFDQSGNQRWMQSNYTPQIATIDGGVIATSQSGQAVTFDQNGNQTGQLASLPKQSWTGNSYQIGSVKQVADTPINAAISFESQQGGNPSTPGTSITTVSFQKHIDTDNPPQGKNFTDVSLDGISISQTENVLVTLGAGTKPVTLTLSSTGTGKATFDNDTTTTTIPVGTKTQVVRIKGVTASQKAGDITLTASTDEKTTIGSVKFSIVSVAIAWLTSTSDTIPDDNSAKSTFLGEFNPSPGVGSSNFTGLGLFATDAEGFSCHGGAQFAGTVTPSDYKGSVVLKRTLVTGKLYDGVEGLIRTLPDATHPPDDTSVDGARDDDPQSGGSKGTVYDLDAPGADQVFPSGTTRYLRMNLVEYAVLDDKRNSVPVSQTFPWFVRVSCGMDASNPSIVFLLNDEGDNILDQGSTSLAQ